MTMELIWSLVPVTLALLGAILLLGSWLYLLLSALKHGTDLSMSEEVNLRYLRRGRRTCDKWLSSLKAGPFNAKIVSVPLKATSVDSGRQFGNRREDDTPEPLSMEVSN